MDKSALLVPFSNQEIHEAMKDIRENKSPGANCFSSAFFQTHWNIIGASVIHAVNHFFTTGYLLKEWNQTY